ncbi:WD repeat-containing protein 3 [Gracilariopsis chorda]|uniref:WD repeat-containing protein 3 n=1 Tax=Gracilariopsis chorda TaxID=448386 RepID=A0A2V3IW14_9FLOR|nr:WD repeat-containing protein 3 [Gracilariopsis chorda]|eukprot:PXF46279.1 WD repeat-containing protein 3 [Gracilariopsis chorda]
MVKAYLKYEQVASFGVVASGTTACLPIKSPSNLPLVVCAAGDIVLVWNLRTGESIARLGNLMTRKAGPINAIAVSAGGETIASGYADGSIRLWEFSGYDEDMKAAFDENEPEPLVTFNGHRSGVSCLAFEKISLGKNSKGDIRIRPSSLVSGSNDGDIIMWNITEGKGVFRFPAHNDALTRVLYFKRESSSFIVSSSKDGIIKVYDVETQHCVQTIVGHRAEVWAMELDPTNSLLVTGSADAEIRGYLLRNVTDEFDPAKATGGDLDSFEHETVFRAIGSVQRYIAAERVTSLHFTECDGETYMLVGSADKNAEVFSVREAKKAEAHRKRREKRKIEANQKEIRATSEEKGWDESLLEEKLRTFRETMSLQLDMSDFVFSVRQIRMSKRLRSICFLDGALEKRVKSKNETELHLIVQPKDNVIEVHKAIMNSSKKRRKEKLGNEGDDMQTRGNVNEIKKLITLDFPGHRSDVRSLSLAPDDNTLLSASDGSLKLWNVGTQKCIRSMKFDGYGLCTQFVGAEGRIGVVGTKSGGIHVYDLGSGTLITEERSAHTNEIWSMCLNDKLYEADLLVTGGSDKRVCMWGIDEVLTDKGGKLTRRHVLEMPDEVLCVKVVSQRDRAVLVVSLMDSTVRAFFMDTFEPYLSFYGHRLPVMCLDVSSDGLILATGSADKTVKLWGMDFGDCRRSLRAHSESVLSLAFQPNTHYLFTGSRDGTLKYWDADKFEFVCEIEGQRGEVWSLATSDDGEIIASASHDKLLRVWRRTDEPLFLEEERDRRMDEMFESALVEEDLKEAAKSKKGDIGFMKDMSKGEAAAAGKRSLETVKGGERLLEALQLCAEEEERRATASDEAQNPMMLGLSSEAYILRTLEQIKTAELEEALHILPLKAAADLLDYCSRLLSPDCKFARLSTEMLIRSCLYLIKLHHSQITAGAISRKLISDLQERTKSHTDKIRKRMGFNSAALQFWQTELVERDDTPFRDAAARVHNMKRKKFKSRHMGFVR